MPSVRVFLIETLTGLGIEGSETVDMLIDLGSRVFASASVIVASCQRVSSSKRRRFRLPPFLPKTTDFRSEGDVISLLVLAGSGGQGVFGAVQDTREVDMNVQNGSLASRLILDPKKDADFVPLSGSLIQKYIAYARTFLSKQKSLRSFICDLRDRNTSADAIPTTVRQQESLVRLAEARARLDLREEMTAQDAIDLIETMKESLYGKYVDEHGFVDLVGVGEWEIYTLADRMSLRVPDIDTFVDNLNSVGYLLKKGLKTYQISNWDVRNHMASLQK
ncbi:MCM, AAA-lid domain [Dillenia turbinata]|uniref:DNA helicase n=1 Tax=Dillenia turbinata TaxID=194707 RepID=A0AAN8VZW6_9MAGN